MQANDVMLKSPALKAVPATKAPTAKPGQAAPKLASDSFVKAPAKPKPASEKSKPARKAPPSPSAKVPGEEVRNTLSIASQVVGPAVTAKQTIGMLAAASFKSPLLQKGAEALVRFAGAASKLPVIRSAAVGSSLKLLGRAMPFLSAGILAFDGFAFFKTIFNPQASGTRKALTTGRFLANAVATAVSFIPGAGFVYALAPALVGNVFEFGLMKLNSKEEKQAAK